MQKPAHLNHRFVGSLLAAWLCGVALGTPGSSMAASGQPASAGLPAGVPPEIVAIIAAKDHGEAVRAALAQVPPPCPAATYSGPRFVAVLQAPRFGPEKRLAAGAWREQFTASGCGGTRTMNVLSSVGQNGDLRVVALLPGSTMADPLLQRDAVRYAYVPAALLVKDCKEASITDTRFDGFTGEPAPEVRPGREARPWRETWTVLACGKLVDVPIQFVPDATGTGISSEMRGAKLRP